MIPLRERLPRARAMDRSALDGPAVVESSTRRNVVPLRPTLAITSAISEAEAALLA
jgi:hypothetical protein